MKKLYGVLIAILLSLNSIAFAQGTQISGSQIKDDTITNAKIKSDAQISHTKINFSGFNLSIINAENPLTFNTPLVRTSNTISLSTVPVSLGGTGLTTIGTGRLLFGGSSPTAQAATSANLIFDTSTSAFTVTGSGHFTTTLLVGGNLTVSGTTASINGKSYVWPAAFGDPGSFLEDVAGDGVLSWAALSNVTLQGSDPGTPDTGGLNISDNAYIGKKVTSDTTASRNIVVTGLAVPTSPTVTPQGTPGTSSWTYVVAARLSDGTSSGQSESGFTVTGNDTLDETNFNRITWDAVPGAANYDVWRVFGNGSSPVTTGKITPTPITVLTLDDTGLASDADPIPEGNSTGTVSASYFAISGLGDPVSTATTISPTGSIFHIIDSSVTIDTITIPYTGFLGSITIIPESTFAITSVGGNIGLSTTAVIGKALIMTYDGSTWYPSY